MRDESFVYTDDSPRSYPAPVSSKASDLTPRQLEILSCVVDGLTNKEISRKMNVTEATVKAHVTAILRFLNIPNRARVAKAVFELGITLPRR